MADRWQGLGPVGKLHGVIVYVRASPQRQQLLQDLALAELEALQEAGLGLLAEDSSSWELQLVLDNKTRWNSTYKMIDRAIIKRSEVDEFIHQAVQDPNRDRQLPETLSLTQHDWLALTEIKELLEPLYTQTLSL